LSGYQTKILARERTLSVNFKVNMTFFLFVFSYVEMLMA
jgi:hypothetical protein